MQPQASQQDRWIEIAANEPGSLLLHRAPTGHRSGRTLLFRKPEHIIEAHQPDAVRPALQAIEQKLAEGFHLAGYIAYEAGFALEPALASLASPLPGDEPLLWLGCYREPQEESFPTERPVAGAEPPPLRFSLTPEAHRQKVEIIRNLIAAGETYQANLTMDVDFETNKAPADLFVNLLEAQPVPYAALLHPQPGRHILSFSPELFFERDGDRIVNRPMKGTAAPGLDAAENRAQAERLRQSEKDRAENVMIVDLLRSDLGRICQTGSVRATELFEVETYPTVLQMTSTVEGRLRPGTTYEALFSALFPSGSIVGAPKIHTMRLLHGLEGRPRGVYTGAIGYIAPGGRAEFNVAIRTLSLRHGKARLGVGSGITYDSDPALEYAECLTKTAFLHRQPAPRFQLIETLRLDAGIYTFLDQHLERMAQSAEYFGFVFNGAHIRAALAGAAASWQTAEPARVRLLLDKAGAPTCTIATLFPKQRSAIDIVLSEELVSADDRFLRHKTTNRALYDRAFEQAQQEGFADCLFRNTRQEITECAIHNLLALIDGEWITPPLFSGVLPGIYRQHLLQQGRAVERILMLPDLLRAEAIYLSNSVRGLRPVDRIFAAQTDKKPFEIVWKNEEVVTGG